MAAGSIFLTGGTGYLGQEVVRELVRRGMAVTALVRRPTELPGCHSVVGDLGGIEKLNGEIANAGAIIHLASSRPYEQSIALAEIAAMGRLIGSWRNGPFVFISSGGLAGWGQQPLREDAPPQLHNWYLTGKFCNEFQLRLAQPLYQRGPAISLRPAGLFICANDRRHGNQRFDIFYRQCRLGCRFVFKSPEAIETYGSSFIGGNDFGRAVELALGIKAAGAYNVAGGFCTWRELIETVNRCAGAHASFIVRTGDHLNPGEFLLPQSRTLLDTEAFKTQTSFASRESLPELIEEFVRAEQTGAAKSA